MRFILLKLIIGFYILVLFGINCMMTILYSYIGMIIIGKFIVNLWYFASWYM